MLLILNPIVLIAVGRIDHLRNDLVVGLQNQNSSSVLVLSTIVSGREDSNKCAPSESLESIHHALMGTDDHVEVVLGEETLHSIRPEFNDVACL